MTAEMLAARRRNAAGRAKVEFHQATIDRLPLPDSSVDCVISNCVINLAPRQASRLSRDSPGAETGGRLAISDIATKQPLPPELGNDLMAYVGCIAGAISFDDYRVGLVAAGFDAVQIVDSRSDLNAYAKVDGQSGCCSPSMSASGLPIVSDCCSDLHSGLKDLLTKYNVNEYAASVKIYAVRPIGSKPPTTQSEAPPPRPTPPTTRFAACGVS